MEIAFSDGGVVNEAMVSKVWDYLPKLSAIPSVVFVVRSQQYSWRY